MKLLAQAIPVSSRFDGGERVGLVFFALIVVGLYLLPTMIASIRRVPGVGSIAVMNVLLGWTMLWWVVSLASACQHVERPSRYRPVHTRGLSVVRAGWYCDPIWPNRQRYHDGTGWTDHVAVER